MRKKSRVVAVILTLCLALSLGAMYPSAVYADTVGPRANVNGYDDPAGGIYVSPSGNDTTGNGSSSNPYKSINTALSRASAGGTIILRNGTYTEGINVRVSTANITIKSAKGEWAVIDLTSYNAGHQEDSAVYFYPGSNGGKLQGLEVRGGFYAVGFETMWDWGQPDNTGASNIIIEDCVLHDSRNDVIKIKPNCDNVTIRYCEIYNSGRAWVGDSRYPSGECNSEGIDIVNGDNIHVHHNYIHDICSTGVYAKGGATDAVIEYNRVERTNAAGIMLGFDTNLEYFDTAVNPGYYENIRGIARHNLVIDSGWEGIGIYASRDVQVFNNTLVNASKGPYHSAIYFGIAPQDGTPFNGSPASVNPSIHHNIVSQPNTMTHPMVEIRYAVEQGHVLSALSGNPNIDNNCYYIAGKSASFIDNRPGNPMPNASLAAWRSHVSGEGGSIEANPGLNPDFIATNALCLGMGIQTPLTVGPGGTPSLPSSKDITSFTLLGVPGTITGTAIAVSLPNGTNVTSCTPVVAHNGASITPSGARDFTSPVTYTVTAQDGSAKSYTVTVTILPYVPPTPLPVDGLYTISPKCAPGLVLDVSGCSVDNGANVHIWSDNTSPAQTFSLTSVGNGYHTLANVYSGKLLDVRSAGQASGTNVWQWASNNTNAQRWQLTATADNDGSFYLRSACNGLYLDINGASRQPGANVHVWSQNHTNAQKFYFKPVTSTVAPGAYTIASAVSGSPGNMVVDIASGSKSSGANVQLWTANRSGAQSFRLTYSNQTGYYTITNTQSSLALDVRGGGSAAGTNVWQYTPNNSRAQWWRIIANSDGSYSIVSATGSGCCLDVAGAGKANGTNIQIYTPNNTPAQRWRFAAVQ